jgi:hypothetical protein
MTTLRRRFTCIVCTKTYDDLKSRADYRGFCSQKCYHALMKVHGWKGWPRPEDPAWTDAGRVWRHIHALIRQQRDTVLGADRMKGERS